MYWPRFGLMSRVVAGQEIKREAGSMCRQGLRSSLRLCFQLTVFLSVQTVVSEKEDTRPNLDFDFCDLGDLTSHIFLKMFHCLDLN